MMWLEKLDLERAIREIQSEEMRSKDFCLDPLRFEDLSLKPIKDALIKEIKDDLSSGKYQVRDLVEIDVPKQNFILRPAARPCLIDWIVYAALTNFICDKVFDKVPKNSFSFNRFREKHKKSSKKSIVDYWKEFENEGATLSQDKRFRYVLITDITAFFEHISVDELNKRLKLLSTDKSYVEAVDFLTNNLLGKWTANNRIPRFGLPQGPTASTILADIYLYSVDKSLNEDKNLRFLRYMDDFRLFVKDKVELKKAIATLVKKLRELKLNLNAKKTTSYLLSEKKSLEKVFDPNRKSLNLIDRAFKSRKKELVLLVFPYLAEFKDHPNETFRERYFKFFIGKIIDLMKFGLIKPGYVERLTDEFLGRFTDEPHLSDKLCWFFVAAGNYSKDTRTKIVNALIKFICSRENIYEWQEMWALDTIRQLSTLNKSQLKKIEKKYSAGNCLCYEQFALIAGKSGDPDTREKILNLCKTSLDEYRATLLALQDIDKKILGGILKSTPEYYRKYIGILRGKKYGFYFNLGHHDLIEMEWGY